MVMFIDYQEHSSKTKNPQVKFFVYQKTLK